MKYRMKSKLKRVYLFLFDFCLFNMKGLLRHVYKDENVKHLEQLKDIHKGERCFIVATGPSLRVEDVEKLKNEYTFSVNSIFLIGDKTSWRSTYYMCLDEKHMINMLEKYGDKIDSVCNEFKFFNSNSRKDIDVYKKRGNHLTKDLYLDISRINELRYLSEKERPRFYFRTDPVWGIYNSGTVTNSAIIIAMWMGFTEIYLLGTDCNYSGKIRHVGVDWNEKNMSINEKELIELRMKNGFNEIAKVSKKYGTKIFNATRGGMLESFERVDFDKLTFKGEN